MKRGRRRPPPTMQVSLLDHVDDELDDLREADLELQRDVHRMTLETSSNVYAQRRSTW